MTKIVVWVKDLHLEKLLTLELQRIGYTVSDKKEECEIFITDSEREIPPTGSKKILISNVLSQKVDYTVLKRPVDLASLRECVASLLESKKVNAKNKANDKIAVNKKEKCAIVGGKKVQLTENEFLLLSRLIEENGNPITREQINALLHASGNTPEVYICGLRKKLTQSDGVNPIITVRGKGYKLR